MSEEERNLLDVEFIRDESKYRFVCFHKYNIDYVERHGFDFRIINPENDDVLLKSTYTFFGGLLFPAADFDHNDKLITARFMAKNRDLFLFGVKNWLSVMLQNKARWDVLTGKTQSQFPAQIQESISIQNAEDYKDVGVIEAADQKKYIVLKTIQDLLFSFGFYSAAGIYLSTELTLEEVMSTLNYFDSKQILNFNNGIAGRYSGGNGGHINQERFDRELDRLEPVCGDKMTALNNYNSLFNDVNIFFDENEFVFMIMPFSKENFAWLGEEKDDESLRHFISSNSKALCITLDDDHESDDRVAKIYNYIKKSKFCIAEISSLRPNIVYEVGLAHGIGRKVILLCSMPDLRIQHPELTDQELFKKYLEDTFDINHNRIHFFNDNQELKKILGKAIEQTMPKL